MGVFGNGPWKYVILAPVLVPLLIKWQVEKLIDKMKGKGK